MKNRKITNGICLLTILFLLYGCYKEEHFDMPATVGNDSIGGTQYPFPFTADKSEGVYLIQNGQADYKLIGTKGFTDFAPNIPATTLSWYNGTDIYGNTFYGSRQHVNFYSDLPEDNFGGEKYAFECNDIFSRLFLKNGRGRNWYVYAKMALTSLGNNTLCHFSYEGNTTYSERMISGFDDVWGQPELFCYRKEGRVDPIALSGARYYYASIYKWNFDQMVVGDPFIYEILSVDGTLYIRMNGVTVLKTKSDVGPHARQLIFRPMANSVHFYDLYVEGDYEKMDMTAYQHENGYTTVQAPALAQAGDRLLLFAEGRKENMIQSNHVDAVRENATDIVTKTSGDGGITWSDLSVRVGGDGTVNMRPATVKDAVSGKLHLLYTVDVSGDQNGNYRMMQITSDNNGQSWSAPVEIPCTAGDYSVSTLSGHGIQASDGSLIVPVQESMGRACAVATLRSTDGGQSWELGKAVDGLRNHYANLVEVNNRLTMYIGHNGGGESRKEVYSTDFGQTWSAPVDAAIHTGNYGHQSSGATLCVDGKLIHFTANDFEKADKFSLSSVPGNRNSFVKEIKEMYLYNAPDMMSGLTVTESKDGGTNWTTPENLLQMETYKDFKFRTGNMDAVVWNGQTVVCVCEGGVTVPYEGLLCFRRALSN